MALESNRVEIVICNVNCIGRNRNETCNFGLQARRMVYMKTWWWLNTAVYGMGTVCLLIQSNISK